MLATPTTTLPVLETERLILRQLSQADNQEVHRLLTDPDVNKHYGRLRANSFEEACTYIDYINVGISKSKVYYWGVCLRGEQKIAGTVCLWNLRKTEGIIEIGYELLPEWQGKGFMQELLPVVIDFAFNTLGYQKIDAWPNLENERSIRLLEKNKFRRDHEAEKNIDWSKEPEFYRDNEYNKKVETTIYSRVRE